MIKLKKLIQEEVIEKLLFEDDDETVTYTYDGKKHKIKKSTALDYARQVSMGDEDVTDQMKAAVKAFPDIAQDIGLGDDDAEAEKEAGKLKGGDFDREADKDDEKEKMQKELDHLRDKAESGQIQVMRGFMEEEDLMKIYQQISDLEDKMADME